MKDLTLKPCSDPKTLVTKTVNQLKGKVTMLFITHAMPKALMVDGVLQIGQQSASAEGNTSSREGVRELLQVHPSEPPEERAK
jgi:ABC-type transport system involved in cytochrome bd biosynthesis fused ATPase/permease subunit